MNYNYLHLLNFKIIVIKKEVPLKRRMHISYCTVGQTSICKNIFNRVSTLNFFCYMKNVIRLNLVSSFSLLLLLLLKQSRAWQNNAMIFYINAHVDFKYATWHWWKFFCNLLYRPYEKYKLQSFWTNYSYWLNFAIYKSYFS